MNEIEDEISLVKEKQWPEDRLDELFRILQPLCFKYIKATHLLPNLPFLRPHASKITKKERKSAPEATELLFQIIRDSEEPEKWKQFTLALRESEFLSLYKVCSVCEKNDFDFYIQIFELLSLDFDENGVKIVVLSQGMLELKNLTEKQFQHIKLVLDEGGQVAAILEFLSCLPSSLEIWLKGLLSCLYAIGKKDLHKLIQEKGNEIHVYNNIDLELKLYYDDICLQVRPQDIQASLKPYDLIPDMNVNTLSQSEQMSKILNNIERSETPGKWRSFLDALKYAGYEKLHTKLDGGIVFDDSQEINNLRVRTPEISKCIEINTELLSEIRASGLINIRCHQEIERKKDESGNVAAAEMLLENIHKFKANWHDDFLGILESVGQGVVAKKIDPEIECRLKTKEVGDDVDDRIAYKLQNL